ncbi:unnamed protein product [Caenorhabditis bovis]|uniref:C2H2-type domain-containing protein n=1 Tax=Caenorhabditis bovis TaxID=2654633 RepID=A0A8S1EDD1_9PELO|nr:unnamed protein product [Caenorhabditis bovis]
MASPLTTDDNNLPCPQCPKTFTSLKLLQTHQQMFHTDKAFICETCGKAFRFRSNLAEHRSVHTALKPYVCKFCGKSSRLKGNLTKHILKHHKKEQNDAIGKDDIIVTKKEPTVSATPSASSSANGSSNGSTAKVLANNNNVKVELDDPSFYNLTSTSSVNGAPEKKVFNFLPREETTDHERSILISLGLDYTSSLDLRETPETSVSPDNVVKSIDFDSDGGCFDSPLINNTTGGETSLAALIAQVNGSGAAEATKTNGPPGTQCPECGKHVRKSSYLQVHMSLHHGFPPLEAGTSSDDKNSEANSNDDSLQSELRAIANAICDLRASQLTTPKIEQLLCGIDARVSRLEKNMDMALNSIYTLVQLQTGMNSSVNRFKDDAASKLQDIKLILEKATSS